uniref:Uncharacterized protein n=2 Tax=Tetraodon nigroviridis TaxID=99883 RepID=H3CF77_TETNG
MEREELLRVEWRETASEMEAGGRTISAGTGARDRRRSAGYRSTLPFFLHNDAEAHAERQPRPEPPTTELGEPAFLISFVRFWTEEGSLQRPGASLGSAFLCLQCAIGPCYDPATDTGYLVERQLRVFAHVHLLPVNVFEASKVVRIKSK